MTDHQPAALPPQVVRPGEQVRKWILEGQSAADLTDAILQVFPEENPQRIIERALEEIAHRPTIPGDDRRGWCDEAAREIYRRMLEVGDYAGALKALKFIRDNAPPKAIEI